MEREVVLTEDGYNKLTEEIEHLKAQTRMLRGQIGAKEGGGSPAAMANVERQLREQVSSLEQKITALAEENRTLRMEVRAGSGKPPAATATKPPPEAAESPRKLFSHRAFTLQLVSAKVTAEEVVLRFLFTNRKERIGECGPRLVARRGGESRRDPQGS